MTKLEREDDKKLLEELKLKRQSDKNWVIKNEKVVPKRKPCVPPNQIGGEMQK